MITRRNTLAVLGITTASLGIEDAAKAGVTERPGPMGPPTRTPRPSPAHGVDRKAMVQAVRKFADAVEAGEFGIKSVHVESTMEHGNVAVSQFTVQFFNKGVDNA